MNIPYQSLRQLSLHTIGSATFWGKNLLSIALVIASASAPLLHPHTRRKASAPQKSQRWQMGTQELRSSMAIPDLPRSISPFAASILSPQTKAARQQDSSSKVAAKGVSYVILHAEFESVEARAAFAVSGAYVFNVYDRFADIFIPISPKSANTLRTIGHTPGLKYIEPESTVTVPPPPRGELPKQRGQQPAEKIVQGGLDGLTGKGVIIAIVDSGVDFRNPDFITYDAAGQPVSRLRYLWDTISNAFDAKQIGSKPPLSYPNGASVGTLYTQQQLTAELRASTSRIPATDLVGHGTACAGVAAGNGNNGKGKDYVKGVAPEADIIAIRAGGGMLASGKASEEISNAWLLNAICGWLDTVAGTQPLVVSCSYGGQFGGHDGQRISERQLDARFASGTKSRALVVAAGNEGTLPLHAEAQFTNKAERISWQADGPVQITLYFDNPHAKDIQIRPAFKTSPVKQRIKSFVRAATVNPITGNYEVQITSAELEGGLYVYNLSGTPMKVEAYIEGGNFVDGASFTHLVATPGVVNQAITVGSYAWNEQFDLKGQLVSIPSLCDKQTPLELGGISCYSSPGLSRNGVVKPDIVAPGEIFHASYAKHANGKGVYTGQDVRGIDSTGNYRLFNGTSAATPYAAGVIALMFQKKPQLTVGEIKEYLQRHATQDHLTGKLPNSLWGYGKLDLAATRRILSAMK